MSAGKLAAQLGFTPGFLNQLRALVLQNKRMLPGPGAGRRRSPRSGSSVELMDYRNYVHGDDLRRLDWNVYARLDTLFIRVFRAEENLLVRIFVDSSKSMSFGTPAKFALARQLAAALSYMALLSYDRVQAAAIGSGQVQFVPTASGEPGTARIWQFLSGIEADGTGNFAKQLQEAATRSREPGLTIIISDGLMEGGLIPALKPILAAGHELAVLHVLDREEIDPTLEGDWRLTDVEYLDRQVEVTLTPVTTESYRQRMQGYIQELRDFGRRQGAGYFLIPSDTSVEDAIFGFLRGTLTQ